MITCFPWLFSLKPVAYHAHTHKISNKENICYANIFQWCHEFFLGLATHFLCQNPWYIGKQLCRSVQKTLTSSGKVKHEWRSYELRVQIHELQVQIHELRVQIYARVARLKAQVGRLKARVGRLKARVRRLKARVEAIKPRVR